MKSYPPLVSWKRSWRLGSFFDLSGPVGVDGFDWDRNFFDFTAVGYGRKLDDGVKGYFDVRQLI